jgi:hypothetical protein
MKYMAGQGSTMGCSAIGWMDGWMDNEIQNSKQIQSNKLIAWGRVLLGK